ncbi:MAG: hypothetical protein WA398_01880 [Nitrososphaeraceae archaeon]
MSLKFAFRAEKNLTIYASKRYGVDPKKKIRRVKKGIESNDQIS